MTEEELSRKVDEIAAKMTIEEKIAFCSGKDFWHIREMAGCEVPEMMMTDGPNGLRKQNGKPDALGAEGSEEATCFPTAVTAAQTWNRKGRGCPRARCQYQAKSPMRKKFRILFRGSLCGGRAGSFLCGRHAE